MHQSLPCAFILIFYLFFYLFVLESKRKLNHVAVNHVQSLRLPKLQEHYLNFIRYLSEICINSQLFCHSIYHRCTFHTHGWMMKNFDMSFKNKENGKVNKRHISYVETRDSHHRSFTTQQKRQVINHWMCVFLNIFYEIFYIFMWAT